MALRTIVRFLDSTLKIADWKNHDSSVNGVQVRGRSRVDRIGFAVDGCMATFKEAARRKCDMIVVHHGILWRPYMHSPTLMRRQLAFLREKGITLYAAHLPLDAHPKHGNNAVMAQLLGLQGLKKFGRYHGRSIGYEGTLKKACSLKGISVDIATMLDSDIDVLGFGPKRVRRIAIASGKADDCAYEAIDKGIDLLLVGETSHSRYHVAEEGRLNLVFGGHYATEVFGLRAIQTLVAQRFSVPMVFIHLPTGY
ncbi:Nif3-like dinuclear metal center hexameric protein [Candidatus Woesearchaeota archaeon]|nr:Nif3-like dinuclear metal center hexameric protein [Candidatus Woesearchaeota archaeon]